jgi:hypothetical protein
MMLTWSHDSARYARGYYIGSTGDDGEHRPDLTGWPFSIYRKASAIGACDAVLCEGIQSYGDAVALVTILEHAHQRPDFADVITHARSRNANR